MSQQVIPCKTRQEYESHVKASYDEARNLFATLPLTEAVKRQEILLIQSSTESFPSTETLMGDDFLASLGFNEETGEITMRAVQALVNALLNDESITTKSMTVKALFDRTTKKELAMIFCLSLKEIDKLNKTLSLIPPELRTLLEMRALFSNFTKDDSED